MLVCLESHSRTRVSFSPKPQPEMTHSPAASPAGTGASASFSAADAFWTACPHCCYVHSYPRVYLGRLLRCPTPACRRPFSADALPSPPPVVPGADMYFCTWAFFPLGPPAVPDGWSPFTPFNPAPPPSPSPTPAATAATPAAATPARARPTSRKKVGVCLKGRARAEAEEEEEAAANLEAEVAPKADGLEEKGGSGINININETVELSELGFRDDELGFLREMP